MDSDEYEYYWDNNYQLNKELFRLDSVKELENIKINGINALELLNNQKIDIKIINDKKTISKGLYDKFGEIYLEYNDEIVRKIRIAPWKLSKKLNSPKEVYEFVSDEIFRDISSFLSYVIQKLKKDIKSIDNFSYQLLEEFPKSYDFLVNLLDYNNRLLSDSLLKLYHGGPIHKEIAVNTGYTGSKLILTSLTNSSPYPFYVKKHHSHDTLLNQMMFQVAYYMMQASKLIEKHLDRENKYLKNVTQRIFHNCQTQLNKYNLWAFYDLDVLDVSELRTKLLTQNNPHYIEIYKAFRIIKDIIIYLTLIAAIRLEKSIEMALKEFYTIYEIWAVAKVFDSFKKDGFELDAINIGSFGVTSVKMVSCLKKKDLKIQLFWELHLDPLKHSTYYGGLVNDKLSKKDFKHIKPDITIIKESNHYKKVFIGDVKFILNEKSPLPTLDSLYKVVSYMEDLKKSPLFKNAEV
ncbi:MAG TPA: hypothetical protein GX531_05155, partial [Methanothermobacter sp.]|nr:hypothetical protein [Methanothermobacter sp.]